MRRDLYLLTFLWALGMKKDKDKEKKRIRIVNGSDDKFKIRDKIQKIVDEILEI